MSHVHTFTDAEGVQRLASYAADCDSPYCPNRQDAALEAYMERVALAANAERAAAYADMAADEAAATGNAEIAANAERAAGLADMAADEAAAQGVAWDRAETDPCERGTVGCSVRHTRDSECDTW